MRKRLLIKPRLQLQHLSWTLGVTLAASLSAYFVFEAMLRTMLLPGTVSPGQWVSIQQGLRAGYTIVIMILSIAIGLENYLLFHRIVGPLYALERGLKRLAEGRYDDVVHIREGDYLKDVVATFEEMKAILRQRISIQESTAQELERLLSDTSLENITAVRAHLKAIRDRSEKKAA